MNKNGGAPVEPARTAADDARDMIAAWRGGRKVDFPAALLARLIAHQERTARALEVAQARVRELEAQLASGEDV